MKRPSSSDDSRSGASRKSSAERDGGVSTTMRSQRRVGIVVQLAELLHRHVLLRPGEGARQRDVEGVLEDLLGLLRRGRGLDDLVEGPLHVEHHRVEAAAGPEVDSLDRSGRVVELGQAHRLGEASGRVDGEDAHLPALLSGTQREGCGRRRLADAAGAAADDDVDRAVGQQPVDVQTGRSLTRGRPNCAPVRPGRQNDSLSTLRSGPS